MSPLPAVTELATIDGGTDILPPGPPIDEIRIDGAAAGPAAGIDVKADDVLVTDLTITRFTNAVDLVSTDGAQVTDSILGTDRTGTAGIGNSRGVRAGTATAPATNAEIRGNLISGNGGGHPDRGRAVRRQRRRRQPDRHQPRRDGRARQQHRDRGPATATPTRSGVRRQPTRT